MYVQLFTSRVKTFFIETKQKAKTNIAQYIQKISVFENSNRKCSVAHFFSKGTMNIIKDLLNNLIEQN